jgi:molybdenum cofactor biosynthesis protein MoaC
MMLLVRHNASCLLHAQVTRRRPQWALCMQKAPTQRTARATAQVHIGREAFAAVQHNQLKKGDVLSIAQIAGIMGAKHTSTLIPLCHNVLISKADVHLSLNEGSSSVDIATEVSTVGTTGVEMEALTAASVAALTVYDMCKAITKDAVISHVRLLYKSGGKSGTWERPA